MSNASWAGLLKKEFRLGFPTIVGAFVLMMFFLGLGTYFNLKHQEPGILFSISIFVAAVHFFFLPGYMLVSLIKEHSRMHLWLHSLQTGRNLLLAKLINGVLAAAASMIIPTWICLATFESAVHPFIQLNDSWNGLMIGFLIIAHMIGFSLYVTLWGIFYWVIYRWIAVYFGKISWLITILIIIGGSVLISAWSETALFDLLTEWGAIPINIDKYVTLLPGGNISLGDMDSYVYAGSYVYYTVVAVIVFLVSSWLLDRKVEVR